MTLILVLFVNTASSQNFEDVEAYYLNLQNDTVKGFIKAEDNHKLAQAISFKISETEKEYQIIKPNDCRGFSYDNNRTFVSHIDSINSDTLFMEILNEGPMNLYAYYQQNKTIYYLLKQGESRYYRLEKNNKTIDKEGKEYAYEDRKYLGVLNLVMQDCKKIKSKIPSTKWDKQSIIKLVDTYNNCIDPSTKYKSNPRKLKINLGAEFGALVLAKPTFYSYYLGRFAYSEYKNERGLSIATYVKFGVMRDLSVDLGLGYSYLNLNIYNRLYNLVYYEEDYFTFHQLDIPINLQYNLTNTKLSPFIFVHTAYSIILSHELIVETDNDELSGSFQITNLNKAKWEFGGGVGASYDKKYYLKLEYINTDYLRGISKLINNQSYFVKIGYLF